MVHEETNELKHSTRARTRLTSPSKQDPGGSKIPQPKSLTLRLPFRPRSVQPEHPTPSPPISRNPEPSNPISATSSSNPTIPVFVRMGHATIKLFSGQRDGKEDPGEYLKDIEFAYINDYAGSPAAVKEDDHKSKTSKILFRQHLREGAATWYGDLPKDTKNDWEKLKKEFKAEFKFEDNHKTETFILWQRVSSLSQGEDEPIVVYICRADDLARKLPAALATLGFNVVRGMKDDTQQCRVTFECAKEQDYDFQKVKKFIVAAYQVIGQNGPFETTQEGTTGSSGAAKGSTLTGEDWNQQILPSILQGMHALSTQQETILNTLANTGTRPQPVLNARGSYGNTGSNDPNRGSRGMNPNVTCFACGEKGHYLTQCSNQAAVSRYRGSWTGSSQQAPAIMSRAMLPHGADPNYGYGDQENDQNSPSDPAYDQENYPPGGYHPMAAFLPMSSVLASALNPMAAATRSGWIQKNGATQQATQERSTAQRNVRINDEYQRAQQPAVRPSAAPQIQKQAPPVSNQDLSQSLNQTSFVPTTGKSVLPNQVDQTIYEYPDGDPVLQAPAIKVTKNQVWELVQPRQLRILDPI